MGLTGDPARRRWLVRAVAIAAMALALPLSACGDDDDNGGDEGGGGSDKPYVKDAQRLLDQATKPIEFKPPGPPIEAAKLEGKQVLIVSVDQRVPILAAANRATQEAGDAAGIEVSVFDARADVTRMIQGLEQGLRSADAIVLTGVPIAAVQQQLQKIDDAGIPTVSVLNNQPAKDEPGQGAGPLVYASSAPNYFTGGALVAAKAVVDTDGEANVEIFDTKEITPSPDVVEGMKSVLDKCTECEVSMNSTPLADWATKLTGKAQSVIRENPELDYILPIFDDMAIFITAGIRQAGAGDRVKNAALDGTPAALKLIQDTDIFTADPGQPTGWLGWHVLDQAMRGMLDEKPSDPEIPVRLLDKSNLEGVDVDDVNAPYGDPDYQGGFEQLWGLR